MSHYYRYIVFVDRTMRDVFSSRFTIDSSPPGSPAYVPGPAPIEATAQVYLAGPASRHGAARRVGG